MNRDFLLMMILPPALILGGLWLLPRALPAIGAKPWYEPITEGAHSLWERFTELLPWEEYPQSGPTIDNMTYPEGTLWAIAPGLSEPFPIIPGTEEFYNINYPGWSYV
jgi:hypothetical protein